MLDKRNAIRTRNDLKIITLYRWYNLCKRLKEANVEGVEHPMWKNIFRTYSQDGDVVHKCGDMQFVN